MRILRVMGSSRRKWMYGISKKGHTSWGYLQSEVYWSLLCHQYFQKQCSYYVCVVFIFMKISFVVHQQIPFVRHISQSRWQQQIWIFLWSILWHVNCTPELLSAINSWKSWESHICRDNCLCCCPPSTRCNPFIGVYLRVFHEFRCWYMDKKQKRGGVKWW